MLSIGEFSRVTELTVKALRLYHEKGLLIPDQIDYDSKYRYYRGSAVEKALVIKRLKEMGFSLEEIKKILLECSDDKQMLDFVEEKLKAINRSIQQSLDTRQNLSLFLQRAKEETSGHWDHPDRPTDIKEEVIPGTHICSIRFKGKYHEVGQRFMILGKKCGRYAKGKPFSLYYDGDYKEDGADIEACVEVRKKINIEGIACRELKAGMAITLIHKGPYRELSRSYQKLFEYCRELQLKTLLPIREQYLKGPGIIFRGNPKKYVTKLLVFYG